MGRPKKRLSSKPKSETTFNKTTLTNNSNYHDVEYAVEELNLSELLSENQTNSILIITETTHEDITQLISCLSVKYLFPFNTETEDTTEIILQLKRFVFDLNAVHINQLADLYHLAIMLHTYNPLETHGISYSIELLDAVSELADQLQPEYIDVIGRMLCDKFVLGIGQDRMKKVVLLHKTLLVLIQNSDVNRKISMAILLATLTKVSGISKIKEKKDIICNAFEVMKLVDWMQMCLEDRFEDVFVLVRCFSLIINTQANQILNTNWKFGIGSEIQKFFLSVLRTFRYSQKHTPIVMMMERFIAFCLVGGDTSHLKRINKTMTKLIDK